MQLISRYHKIISASIASCQFLLCWLHSKSEYLEETTAFIKSGVYFNSEIKFHSYLSVHQTSSMPSIWERGRIRSHLLVKMKSSKHIMCSRLLSFWCLTSNWNWMNETAATTTTKKNKHHWLLYHHQSNTSFIFLLQPSSITVKNYIYEVRRKERRVRRLKNVAHFHAWWIHSWSTLDACKFFTVSEWWYLKISRNITRMNLFADFDTKLIANRSFRIPFLPRSKPFYKLIWKWVKIWLFQYDFHFSPL